MPHEENMGVGEKKEPAAPQNGLTQSIVRAELDMREKGGSEDSGGPFVLRAHAEEDSFAGESMPSPVHWSIAWSDLMMTMFIFFLVLYVYKDANKIFLSSEGLGGDYGRVVGSVSPFEGGGLFDSGETMEKSMSKIYDFSKQTLQREKLDSFASVDLIADEAVRIRMTGDLLFDSGQIELKDDARISLRIVAELLKRTPYIINVVGHTDDVPLRSGIYSSNWELSAMRAGAVARFLIDEMEIKPERIYLTGHASYMPMMPNDTPAHRAANRRVEIIITKRMPYNQ